MPVLLALIACADPHDESLVLSDQVAEDLADLAATIERAARSATLPPPAGAGRCEAAPAGSCAWCVDTEGDRFEGTFGLVVAETPCGGSVSRAAGPASYTVEDTLVSGTYAGYVGGAYLFEATGVREASLDADAYGLDASFTVDRLVASTLDLEVASIELELTYVAFADRTWTLEAVGNAADLAGTLTDEDGAICEVSGTVEAPEVRCEP